MSGRFVLHVPLHVAVQDGSTLPGLLRKLRAGFTARGAGVDIRHGDAMTLATMGDTPDFHVVHNGRVRHPRALNSGLAHLCPVWYLDPGRVFFEPIAARAVFDPQTVDPQEAKTFFD